MARLPAAKKAQPAQADPELPGQTSLVDAATAAVDSTEPGNQPTQATTDAHSDESYTLAEAPETVVACWYGLEGSGKTTNIAEAANYGRILVVNAEAGLKAGALRRAGINIDNIQVRPRPARGDQPSEELTFDYLEALYWKIKSDLEVDPLSWFAICFDSLTEIVAKLLGDVAYAEYQKKKDTEKPRDRWDTWVDDYGVMTNQIRFLLRRYRSLPCHFLATALERRDQDDDGTVAYGPAVNPALMVDIPGFFDVVIHTNVETVGSDELWWGGTRKIGKYRGKDRFRVLPRRLPDPTFGRVKLYVDEELIEDADPILAEHKARRQAAAGSDETIEKKGAKKKPAA